MNANKVIIFFWIFVIIGSILIWSRYLFFIGVSCLSISYYMIRQYEQKERLKFQKVEFPTSYSEIEYTLNKDKEVE